jgi:hypothetical protein
MKHTLFGEQFAVIRGQSGYDPQSLPNTLTFVLGPLLCKSEKVKKKLFSKKTIRLFCGGKAMKPLSRCSKEDRDPNYLGKEAEQLLSLANFQGKQFWLLGSLLDFEPLGKV